MFWLAILFVFIPMIVIITDLGMPNILNWDFAKRWDHLFFDKPRTLRHPTFLCLDSIPTLRRTLRKLPWLAKFNSTRTRSFATPSLCCGELIYLHIYIKSNHVVIRSFWCRDNFFFLRPSAPVHKCFYHQPPVTKRKFCTFRMQAITKWNLEWKKFRF